MYQNLFFKCKECGNIIEGKKAVVSNYACNTCGYYETLDYEKRLAMIIDTNTFTETNVRTEFYDPIKFPGYGKKHDEIVNKVDLAEAVVTGSGYLWSESYDWGDGY